MSIQLRSVAALFLAAAAITSHAQQIVVNKDNRTIAVTTSADANAAADIATVQIGFVDLRGGPGFGLCPGLQNLECNCRSAESG